ncbi:MAG: hypothetical protein LBC51_01380 [Treponema sp.]|nr:hypothetical protein [Treponema sp.]
MASANSSCRIPRALLALDGVGQVSSEKIHCEHCLHTGKEGITTYYPSIMAAMIVMPGDSVG